MLRLDTDESDESEEADWQNDPVGRSLVFSSSAFSSVSVTSRSSALCQWNRAEVLNVYILVQSRADDPTDISSTTVPNLVLLGFRVRYPKRSIFNGKNAGHIN